MSEREENERKGRPADVREKREALVKFSARGTAVTILTVANEPPSTEHQPFSFMP